MQKLRVPESGLGQVCAQVGREMAALDRGPLELEFLVPESSVGCFGKEFRYRTLRVWHRWLGVPAPDCKVWHCLHQDSPYLPANSKTQFVLTIQDLNFLVKWEGHPGAIRRRLHRLQKLVDRAAVITTSSHYVENLVRSRLHCPQPIEVIHHAPSFGAGLAPERPKMVPPGEFLLALGQVNRKKNFHVLLPLLKAEPQWNLVLAGVDDNEYGQEIRRRAKAEGVFDRVVFTGPVPEAQKLWLYQNCQAFLFPSLAEGFGLPVVEAMSQGKPVFLSRECSLPEIGGPEAYYWDDFLPENMVATFRHEIDAFRNDPAKGDKLRAWSDQFRWRRSAQQYLELYRRLSL